MLKKIYLVFVLLLFFSSSLEAYYSHVRDLKPYRYSLTIEYKLVVACIDLHSSGGVSKALRDRCIEKVEALEKKYSLNEIKKMDQEGELEDLFK